MEISYPKVRPEIWGGLECSITRIGDAYSDQLEYAGHYIRAGDLEAFARLGIKKLRYPILWEKHQPDADGTIDWRWTRQQLERLSDLGVTPIAGLLHHGSGPQSTDLLDPEFPAKFSRYANEVARQFPRLTYYTPINEPLTTARFSGLYGFWYPHCTSESSFLCMLINQLKGVILAMQAIRKVNPAAMLVQTEDLAKTHATELLAYQAAYENERRWLSWDLLCGKVDEAHVFWQHFITAGISRRDLAFFLDNPCPPDIIGCNYYVTSERWLDENIGAYPAHLAGGNGRHCYVDTEAAQHDKMEGLRALLLETWNRYGLPIAITECHIDCTREEQLRWIKACWDDCLFLSRVHRLPIVALTVWALMGARDWNSLLTQQNNHYESGVFDVRLGDLRPTALAKMIASLAASGDYAHPILGADGWWLGSQRKKDTAIGPIAIKDMAGTASRHLLHAFATEGRIRKIPMLFTSQQKKQALRSDSIKPWAGISIGKNTLRCSGGLTVTYEEEDLRRVASQVINLLIDGERGLWHISSAKLVPC